MNVYTLYVYYSLNVLLKSYSPIMVFNISIDLHIDKLVTCTFRMVPAPVGIITLLGNAVT